MLWLQVTYVPCTAERLCIDLMREMLNNLFGQDEVCTQFPLLLPRTPP